jgi:hypothetical protein
VAEGAGLENRYTGNGIVGSNPTLSVLSSSRPSGLASLLVLAHRLTQLGQETLLFRPRGSRGVSRRANPLAFEPQLLRGLAGLLGALAQQLTHLTGLLHDLADPLGFAAYLLGMPAQLLGRRTIVLSRPSTLLGIGPRLLRRVPKLLLNLTLVFSGASVVLRLVPTVLHLSASGFRASFFRHVAPLLQKQGT